MPNAFVS